MATVETAISGDASGASYTEQATILDGATKVFPGVIAGNPPRKASYRVRGVSALGGTVGESMLLHYNGPRGSQDVAIPLGVDGQGLAAFSTDFGSDWTIQSLSVTGPILVTVTGELVLSPSS